MFHRYGISSFIYRARVPFHPQRIYDFLDTHFLFVVLLPGDDDDGDTEVRTTASVTAREQIICHASIVGYFLLCTSAFFIDSD